MRGHDVIEGVRAVFRTPVDDAGLVVEFETQFADFVGALHAKATSSGREAMEVAFAALGLVEGDEILVPAYTLGELMPLLQARGYKLVPVDVEADTFNIDPSCVEKRLSTRTRALMVAHILGAPCDMTRIMDVARRRGLLVLEDCAHAMGATIGGRHVGTFGHAALFSLESNKPLPTYGGGMLVTNDPAVAARVDATLADRPRARFASLRKAGSTWLEEWIVRSPFYGILQRVLFSEHMAGVFERSYRGSHSRLRRRVAYSGFQARLGLRYMACLNERNERCNALWRRMAADLPDGMVPQVRDRCGRPAFYNLVVLSTRVDTAVLRRRLTRAGVDVGIGTEIMDNCGPMLGYEDCGNAEEVVARGVLLPVFDGLTEREYERVVRALHEVAG